MLSSPPYEFCIRRKEKWHLTSVHRLVAVICKLWIACCIACCHSLWQGKTGETRKSALALARASIAVRLYYVMRITLRTCVCICWSIYTIVHITTHRHNWIQYIVYITWKDTSVILCHFVDSFLMPCFQGQKRNWLPACLRFTRFGGWGGEELHASDIFTPVLTSYIMALNNVLHTDANYRDLPTCFSILALWRTEWLRMIISIFRLLKTVFTWTNKKYRYWRRKEELPLMLARRLTQVCP